MRRVVSLAFAGDGGPAGEDDQPWFDSATTPGGGGDWCAVT